MDFALTEELQAVADLADRILAEHADPQRLAEVEAEGGRDDRAWHALADTGLLGIAVPAAHGGAGLGWLAVHLLCEAAGRHVAHVPLGETLTAAALLGHLGDPTGDLALVAAGRRTLTLALQDVGAAPDDPTTIVEPDAVGVRVTGTKVVVPWAAQADALLVSAAPPDGAPARVVVVDRADVTVTAQHLSSDVPHGRVQMEGAPGHLVGGVEAVPWLLDHAVAALAGQQAGMLDAVVALAARHTSERQQFGRPLAAFQAVSQRVADAFIDAECARLTALQAAWRLHEGLPASDEVAIAKWWAAEAGHRVLHAAQHVHGGVGVDRDYPLHRYLLRTKQVEFALGSAADQLGRLGAALAADPA